MNNSINAMNNSYYNNIIGLSAFESSTTNYLSVLNQSLTSFIATSNFNQTAINDIGTILGLQQSLPTIISSDFASQLSNIQGMNDSIVNDIINALGFTNSNETLYQLLTSQGIKINIIDQNTLDINNLINADFLINQQSEYNLSNQIQYTFVQLNNSNAFIQSQLVGIANNQYQYSIQIHDQNASIYDIANDITQLQHATFNINGQLYNVTDVITNDLSEAGNVITGEIQYVLTKIPVTTANPLSDILNFLTYNSIIQTILISIVASCMIFAIVYRIKKRNYVNSIETRNDMFNSLYNPNKSKKIVIDIYGIDKNDKRHRITESNVSAFLSNKHKSR
jgi:hypothetical protein